jgi:hypothetical protein
MADLREYHPTLWDRIRGAFGPRAEEVAKVTPMGMAYDGGRNMAGGYMRGEPMTGAFGAAQTALPMLLGVGAFLGRAKPGSEAFDAAAARMLERKYPGETAITGGGNTMQSAQHLGWQSRDRAVRPLPMPDVGAGANDSVRGMSNPLRSQYDEMLEAQRRAAFGVIPGGRQ